MKMWLGQDEEKEFKGVQKGVGIKGSRGNWETVTAVGDTQLSLDEMQNSQPPAAPSLAKSLLVIYCGPAVTDNISNISDNTFWRTFWQ